LKERERIIAAYKEGRYQSDLRVLKAIYSDYSKSDAEAVSIGPSGIESMYSVSGTWPGVGAYQSDLRVLKAGCSTYGAIPRRAYQSDLRVLKATVPPLLGRYLSGINRTFGY